MTPNPLEEAEKVARNLVYEVEDGIPLDEFEKGYQAELITKTLLSFSLKQMEPMVEVLKKIASKKFPYFAMVRMAEEILKAHYEHLKDQSVPRLS